MPMSLSKTGAAFAYWNTEPDGSGIVHGWSAGIPYVMPASNVVLYAQWFVKAGLSAGGLTTLCSCAKAACTRRCTRSSSRAARSKWRCPDGDIMADGTIRHQQTQPA